MHFQQVLNQDLGCASYVLADGGEAIVVDPRWDIDVYCEIAHREGLRITHIVDTHDHADHLSGRTRLAALTGASAHRPAREHGRAEGDLAAGDELAAGSLRLRALATPGHRPEHLALAVSDLSRGPDPWLLLSGDSLLVGDLARPDLAVEPELGARELRASLAAILELGDHVEVWPAHVGGSLCGGPGLSRKTSSTVGFERRHQTLLACDEDTFVERLVANVPARPPNIEHIVARNRRASADEPTRAPALDARELLGLVAHTTIVDVRDGAQFDEAHLAGAINLPASSSGMGTRAGWAIGVEEEIVIVACELAAARRVAVALQTVGLWRQVAITVADPDGWRDAGLAVASAERWDVAALAAALREESVELIDVRDEREWRSGHVPHSHHLPLNRIGDGREVRLPGGSRTIAVACAGGVRAAFGASLLRRGGARGVARVAGGGIGDLASHGIELAVGA